MVCSILSEDAVFMEKFAKQKGHLLTFKFHMGKVEIHIYTGCNDGGLIKKSRIFVFIFPVKYRPLRPLFSLSWQIMAKLLLLMFFSAFGLRNYSLKGI